MITEYHAKYLAYELTKKTVGDNVARLSRSLFDAKVDLNPHQIEAALFALRSPISAGVLLADEVGLGKTIEAGIVLCQYWAERKRRLIIICPASIRKQWAIELEEKFNLPAIVLDQGTYKAIKKEGKGIPFQQDAIVITSFNFAAKMQLEMRPVQWDLVVIDEAHKLRNAYRESNKIGQAIKWATEERKKLLLTATPLQNTLLELYGISTLIDNNLFGDVASQKLAHQKEQNDCIKTRVSLCEVILANLLAKNANCIVGWDFYLEKLKEIRSTDPDSNPGEPGPH